MKSSTSIAALSLAISNLILSVPATPLHARQTSYSVDCPEIPVSIPESGTNTLQEWCTSTANSLICNGPGAPVSTSNSGFQDPMCDACTCKAAGAAPAAAAPASTQPTCTGSVPLNPYLANPPTTPLTLQFWCLTPGVNAVCNPGLSVLGDDTHNVCMGGCTCPS